jgi:phosphohistidine phosphatase
MNKTLILMRHGQAGVATNDFDRPLTEDGKNKCKQQARVLQQHKVCCSVIMTSPAQRAWSSAAAIADVMHYPENKILVEQKLYNASADAILNVIMTFDDIWHTVLMVGHNPGMSALTQSLCPEITQDLDAADYNMISFPLLHWVDIINVEGKVITYA